MILKPDGAGGSRASIRKRWLEGYSIWKKLSDSDENDRVKLEVCVPTARSGQDSPIVRHIEPR